MRTMVKKVGGKTSKNVRGVTIRIAAEVLGVSVNTLRNWEKNGKLSPRRERNGYRYYQIRDLIEFARKNNLRPHRMLKWSK